MELGEGANPSLDILTLVATCMHIYIIVALNTCIILYTPVALIIPISDHRKLLKKIKDTTKCGEIKHQLHKVRHTGFDPLYLSLLSLALSDVVVHTQTPGHSSYQHRRVRVDS